MGIQPLDLDEPHLAGGLVLQPAAGGEVQLSDLHDADGLVRLGDGPFGPAADLLPVGEEDTDRQILIEHLVGRRLGLSGRLLPNIPVQVDPQGIPLQPQSHGVEAEIPDEHRREDMLAQVLLHQLKASGPVDLSPDLLALQGPVQHMDDLPLLLVHLRDGDAVEGPQIAGLAPTAGIEKGLIQHRPGPASACLLPQKACVKCPLLYRLIVQFPRHSFRSFPQS